ncbi:unnamed protein product [Lathyrus oleraceus]
MFSKIVHRSLRSKLLQTSGFRKTVDMGKYLGVSLSEKILCMKDYQYLLEQLAAKLFNWKSNNFSFACRVILTKSVMEAILVYPIMYDLLPKACIEEIHYLQNNFIWGDTMNKRKYYTVSWEIVTRPKEEGGLGLKKLDQMNTSCFMKLVWKLHNEGDDLWCEVLNKYRVTDITKLSNRGCDYKF